MGHSCLGALGRSPATEGAVEVEEDLVVGEADVVAPQHFPDCAGHLGYRLDILTPQLIWSKPAARAAATFSGVDPPSRIVLRNSGLFMVWARFRVVSVTALRC